MSRRGALWLILVAVLAIAAYLALALGTNRRKPVAHSTYTAAPNGCKAAYLFLGHSGLRVKRKTTAWTEPPPAGGLLVVTEPTRGVTSRERIALRRWVLSGGTVLIAGANPWGLWSVGGKPAIGASTVEPFRPLVPCGLTAGVERFHMAAPLRRVGPFRGLAPPVALAEDRFGAALVLAAYGRGRVVLAADPAFLTNERLKLHPDHALFLLNLAKSSGGGRVEFDEYHLGFGRAAKADAAPAGLPPIISAVWWQLLLLAAAYFYMTGRRFGRPLALPETGGRTIAEYVNSLANLYLRAQAGTAALDHLYHGLLERLYLLTGLSARTAPEILAGAAAARLGADAEDLRGLLARCRAALARERIAPAELAALAKRIDHYRKELERWVTLPS